MTKHTAAETSVFEMSLTELQSRAEKARVLLGQLASLLPGLVTLTVEERRRSNGKFQSGEVAAMKKLLVAAGKHPQVFSALADKDGGKDPKAFEVQPALDDLDRVGALGAVVADAEALAQTLADTRLVFGSAARAVGAPVHAIASANRAVDAKLGSDVAEALEFYAARGRSASRARAKRATVAPAAVK